MANIFKTVWDDYWDIYNGKSIIDPDPIKEEQKAENKKAAEDKIAKSKAYKERVAANKIKAEENKKRVAANKIKNEEKRVLKQQQIKEKKIKDLRTRISAIGSINVITDRFTFKLDQKALEEIVNSIGLGGS